MGNQFLAESQEKNKNSIIRIWS